MNPNDFGWRKKDDPSTFFPDSWSEEKIKEEIAWAWGNKIYLKPSKTGGNIYYGTSKNGQKYEIIENINGNIDTVYGVFY